MPGRLRQPLTSSEEVTQQPYIPGLEFNESLTWRAGKAIPAADLVLRLQNLAKELRNIEQDQIDKAAFTRVAQDLAGANLLGHKDKGVRAYVASCIVDILRLCAPDAPFKNAQLKDIFTIIITSILPALAESSNTYHSQHAYVLQSLADTKSIILLTDVDNADSLILPLFTICFDIVSGSSKSSSGGETERAIEYNMTNLVVVVIDEVATLPQEVVDIILSQFLRVDPRSTQNVPARSKKTTESKDDKQSNLLLKDYPPAYNMAKAICTTCPEKMTSQISQYFNNVIVDASAPKDLNGHSGHARRRTSNLDDSDDEVEDVKELSKAHQLIRELWRACPDVLQNVIPQLEAELSAESVPLRLLATETLGDVAAGIGVSGPPPPAQMDSAAYPPTSVLFNDQGFLNLNRLLIPMSPKPFSATHPSAYESFLGRRQDKSPSIRAAWATAVGRILLTSAGGIGFDGGEDVKLLTGLAQMLGDADEKVRLAAIQIVGNFSYSNLVNKFASNGGIAMDGSVMAVLTERLKDRRASVREQAMKVLGRAWAVGSKDIQENVERVVELLGLVPTKIFESVYTGDPEIQALVDEVTFEHLLPISFPPIKAKAQKPETQKEQAKDVSEDSATASHLDPDMIRVRRILTLVKGLDDRSKRVFFGAQGRQVGLSKIIDAYLKTCEDFNGGIVEENEEGVKTQLGKIIDVIAKPFPEPSKMTADLWKFAKLHDRRNYQLIRFAMGIENDYRTVANAIKEITKRIQSGPPSTASLLESIIPLLYRCSLVIYNRSHVPAIMKISRTDEYGLGETAYEVLKEISTRNPEILRSHVQDMCKDLEAHAPTTTQAEEPSAPDTLKACASFARKFPADIPKDRKFLVAMTNYALHSRSPKAAKHAVSIIMTAGDKQAMYARDIIRKATADCTYESPFFLTRLATIAQICLLAPVSANFETDSILKIAVTDTLSKNRSPSSKSEDYSWTETPDDETLAKELALKILVNRCRAEDDKSGSSSLNEIAVSVLEILNKLIVKEGELLASKDTPPNQKSRLRLTATRFLLKLCSHQRSCEGLITPKMFNKIALVALDRVLPVRTGFIAALKKHLSQNTLNHRWYTIPFLLAYEPDIDLQSMTVTWMKSRAQFFLRQQQIALTNGKTGHGNVMEGVFARLLSLLAHHPDFPEKDTEDYHPDLVDYAKYICFYLSTIANEDNLSLIFHIAQRVKQTKDAIVADSAESSERLYILSDLAQATIRNFADVMSHQKGHSANVNILQTWPGKLHLPSALFAPLPNHAVAQQIAEKNYLPEEIAGDLERFVRTYMKSGKPGGHGPTPKLTERKRKSDAKDYDEMEGEGLKSAKKAKKTSTSLPVRKATSAIKTTPKPMSKKRKTGDDEVPSSDAAPSRKSARTSNVVAVSYADRDSDEDDAEMEETNLSAGKQAALKSPTAAAGKAKGKADAVFDLMDVPESDEEDEEKEDEDLQDSDLDEREREASTPASPLRKKRGGNKPAATTNVAATPRSSKSVKSKLATPATSKATKKVTPLKKEPKKKVVQPEPSARETRTTRTTRAAAAAAATSTA